MQMYFSVLVDKQSDIWAQSIISTDQDGRRDFQATVDAHYLFTQFRWEKPKI